MIIKNKWKRISKEEIIKIIGLYKENKSTSEISKMLNISLGEINKILHKEKVIRTIGEGVSIKWKNPEYKKNQINKRKNKPSGAKNKNWKLTKIRRNINSLGNKHHNWKGGRTKLIFSIRRLPEYIIWRKDIFKRDNWTCVQCERKRITGDRVILQADHIIPLWVLIEKNKIFNILEAISCKELWNVKNGRTLCKECHKKTNTYGVNKNGSFL